MCKCTQHFSDLPPNHFYNYTLLCVCLSQIPRKRNWILALLYENVTKLKGGWIISPGLIMVRTSIATINSISLLKAYDCGFIQHLPLLIWCIVNVIFIILWIHITIWQSYLDDVTCSKVNSDFAFDEDDLSATGSWYWKLSATDGILKTQLGIKIHQHI